MAVKKIKTKQAAKAPETPVQEFQSADNLEGVEGTGQEPSEEDGKDTDPNSDTEDGEDTDLNSDIEDGEDAGQDTETVDDVPEKPLPKVLTALRPILYLARQYKAGESLPVNDAEMVEAWIEAGSAEWREKKGGRFFP